MAAALQARVAVWVGGTVTLAGETAPQLSPAGDEAPADRLTVPEKAPTAAMVTVLEHDTLGMHGTGFGLALRLNVLPRLKTALVV